MSAPNKLSPVAVGSRAVPPAILGAVTLVLFLVWSNNFIAVGYLLGSEASEGRFDWVGLTVARFLPAGLVAALYCLLRCREESLKVVRRYPWRLFTCGLLAVPCSNLSLLYGQQHGVPAPIASLTTALVPLFTIILSRLVLRETITARQYVGFGIALLGMIVIAAGPRTTGTVAGATTEDRLGVLLAITAIAPLSWSVFSILSKPVAGEVSPVVWTFLSIAVGTLPLVLIAPFRGGPAMLRLDLHGWSALLFLSMLCSIAGFAVWTWLLQHLKASTLGLTVFLNPPLTTLSKLALRTFFPATFLFAVEPRDLLGGAIAIAGLVVAIRGLRAKTPPAHLTS